MFTIKYFEYGCSVWMKRHNGLDFCIGDFDTRYEAQLWITNARLNMGR